MLSYRHAFHAGNHADVLKHYTLSVVLDYFNQKDKPYCVVDTHAGAGMYALDDAFSQKNREFETGISHLLSAEKLPDSLRQFVEMVQSFNTTKQIKLYPGSPKVSAYYLRQNDQLRLFELHPNDYKILSENFSGNDMQTKIKMQDGFNGIKATLPPTTRRGIVMIDPPYESKDDYLHVVNTIKDCLKRFATGTYIVWYPLLPKAEPLHMIDSLHELQANNWLDARLLVSKPSSEGYGMYGSGLFIINPPWTLAKTLEDALPCLTALLGQSGHASYLLNSHIS
ncbi:MAG: 23S rRNA (adenine(2030)-N(6))-methyltransferase RlmJ [Methylophilaceae bacterium]